MHVSLDLRPGLGRGGPVLTRRERVLILYLGWAANVGRIRRQIDFLSEQYEVVLAAFDAPDEIHGVEFVQLPFEPAGGGGRAQALERVALRLRGSYQRAYWCDSRMRAWHRCLQAVTPFAAVLVNSLYALPLAAELDVPLVFDAHEHWTSESASWSRLRRLSMRNIHEWIVDTFATRCAGIMTVSQGIAADYGRRTGTPPALVTNAPFAHELAPSPLSEPMRILHVGYADPRRRLEDTIEAVRRLDGQFTLDLVLARDNAYRRRLEAEVSGDPSIRILPAVPNHELITFANDYDIGVFLLPARFPNQVHVLPNKLFDYIQARLAIAIGPSQEMAAIVNEWGCGVVSEDFTPQALAAALSTLTRPTVARMKANADRAARVLTAERNRDTVRDMVYSAVAAGRGVEGRPPHAVR